MPDVSCTPRMDRYIQQRLRCYRRIGVKRVRAQASGRDDECSSCKARGGLVYDIDEVPEFPPHGCTCPLGCGCMVTRVLEDSVLKVTVQDDDFERPERAKVASTSSSNFQPDAPHLRDEAHKCWKRFLSSARETKTNAGQLLRVLSIWLAWALARGAAHSIQFITTTLPTQARETLRRAKLMIRKRGKSLTTWASVTLTARNPRP